MMCPKCKAEKTKVYAGLDTIGGNRRRYRMCKACGHRFKTIEFCSVGERRKKNG